MGHSCWKVTVVFWVMGCVREIKKQGPFHKEIFAVVVGATNELCVVWVLVNSTIVIFII